MTNSYKIFFAYPAVPASVGETIEASVNRLKTRSYSGTVGTWRQVDIPGRFIIDGILEKIDLADVLIADISALNFNVTFEVGYAIGARKRVLIVKQAGLKETNSKLDALGIFDTLGYKEYGTAEDLEAIVRGIEDIAPNPLPADRNLHAPIYINIGKYKSDQQTLIQSRVKKAHLFFRTFDPNETPRLSATEAIRNVSQSYGVLVHLVPNEVDDAVNHNLRAAFLAGLALGMERCLLMIQYSETPVPLDCRDAVTYCRLPEQIQDAITEFANNVLDSIQASKPSGAPRPPNFLDNLTFGASSAENELTVLSEYYLEIDAYRRAQRKEVRLITGRKGSGKTAIFFQLRDSVRRKKVNVVLDLKPDGYQLLKFKDQVLKLMAGGTLDHTITAFWEYLLLLEICYKLIEKDQDVHKRDHRLFEPYQRLLAAYTTDTYISEGDFSERMTRLLHHIGEAFNEKYGAAKDLALSQAQITALLYRHDVAKLRTQVQEYLKFKGQLWFLFDNLDKGWPTHGLQTEDLVIIKTLIEATRKIERELTRYDIDAHTVIFLRNDVYELLVEETPDRGKETRANVDWSEPDLLREMLRRRIVFGNPEFENSSFNDIWQHLCVRLVSGDESSQYLIDRSLMRPRCLIELLSHCRGFAVNLRHEIIQEDDIENGLKAYSNDLLSDISLEVRDVLSSAKDVVYGFIGVPVAFNHDKLKQLIFSTGATEDKFEPIFDILLWFGFLGIIDTNGEAAYIYTYTYDMKLFRAAIRKLEQEGLAYQVNPAFWAALGIGR